MPRLEGDVFLLGTAMEDIPSSKAKRVEPRQRRVRNFENVKVGVPIHAGGAPYQRRAAFF